MGLKINNNNYSIIEKYPIHIRIETRTFYHNHPYDLSVALGNRSIKFSQFNGSGPASKGSRIAPRCIP